MASEAHGPVLVMVASPSARAGEQSPFLRFVRDHAETLKRFSLHCTDGTRRSLLSTGLYGGVEIARYKPGPKGGIVQLAALVARRECSAVILLTDALDLNHDEVVTRVVKRIANQVKTRLVTTYGDAVLWARLEADKTEPASDRWAPRDDWPAGMSNKETWPQPIESRTIALTAHDASKRDMVEFVLGNVDILVQHHRILATGVTGWVLRLLFSDHVQEQTVLAELRVEELESRMTEVLAELLRMGPTDQEGSDSDRPDPLPKDTALDVLAAEMRRVWSIAPSPELVRKVIPLLPGPAGGDVLLSKEVLDHLCDTVICFHHPNESLPHTDDSRMLEQTCQLRDVRAACLTNISAALCWASGVRREIGDGFPADLSDQLRARFQLNEVVVVDHPGNADSDALGEALCQAAAGYLNEVVVRLSAQKSARIAVSWGWAGDQVVEQLKRLENAKCITRQPPGFSQGLIWSASIGNLPSPYEMNAGTVAKGLAEFFGGTTAEFTYGAAGYIDDFSKLEQADLAIIRELPKSDLVVTSASAWDEKSGLAQYGHALRSTFPRFDEAIGTVGGVFLDEEGRDVPTKGRIVGMSHEDLRKAAKRGAVVIIAGGDGRRRVVLAALRQRLASVLITSKETARWLVDQQIEPLCEPNVSTETPAMAAGADPIETLLGQAAIRGIDPSSLRNALATSLKLLPGHSMSGAPMAPMSEREIAILAGTRIESAPRESGAPDPVARTAATAATLLAEALTIGGAAERLTATEAEVIDRIRRRALYAVDAVGGFRLPAFQFQPEGLVPGIDRVFQAIPPGLHIVELWTWLTKPDPDFVVQGDARSPRDWLISGGDVMRVIEMAESL